MSFTPLKTTVTLTNTPSQTPRYSSEVKNQAGETVNCGNPDITRALVALMDLGAVNGGAASHWGGPAAIAEAMSATHAIMFNDKNWFDKYNFVNDIGHGENGIYALRANLGFGDLDFSALKGFRSIESKLTGHGESHLYPEGVLLSNGPLSSALPQAQGLAFADKLLKNDRVTIVSMSDGASMEGEAKEAFAAIPGLASKGKMNPFVMIISDNNTKLSGRISDDSFDMVPSFDVLKALGWQEVLVENGNDLQACYTAMEQAIEISKTKGPAFVWLKTTKGYGVKATADSASGGHGFPVKAYSEDILAFVDEIMNGETPEELKSWAKELTIKPETNTAKSSVPSEKAQAGLARGAIRAANEGKPVYSVSSDLQGSTGMKAFQTAHPENFVDIGIAESNMVSHAVGMSRAGFIPIVDTFAAFGVTKGNLPFLMAALSSSPLIAVFSHTGFQDAADGASHQSLTYLSAIGSIPNTKSIVVSTSEEAEALMYQAICEIESDRASGKHAQSYIFFVGRENFPKKLDGVSYALDQAQVIKNGTDGVLLSMGPTLFNAIEAAEKLEKEDGLKLTVINNPGANNPDIATITKALNSNGGKLITIEDHQVIGGFGSRCVHELKAAGVDFKVKTLGVQGCFGRSAYTAGQLYTLNGLDADAIARAFKEL
jgi:transketolase